MAWVAARRGYIRPSLCNPRRFAEEALPQSISASGEPDFNSAALHLLRVFNEGALGRITLLPGVDEARAASWFTLSPSSSQSSHLYK